MIISITVNQSGTFLVRDGMKTTLKLLLLIIPFSISAQQPAHMGMGGPGMNQQDMQKMMAGMQKMQACMQKIDKKKLEIMDQRAQVFSKEIQLLCAKGKRAQAEKKSQKFGKKMMNDPIAKELKKCSDMMTDMIPESAVEDVHACEATQNAAMYNPPKL